VDRLLGALREQGRTVLMATHLLERGADLCDLGVVLEGGRVAWTGPAADLPGEGVAASGLAEGAAS
jgi:ABC-type multidrug transport system ATPase subunit